MKFFINRELHSWVVKVMAVGEKAGGRVYYTTDHGAVKEVEFKEGEIIEPLLVMPIEEFDKFAIAMATYAKDKGLDRKMEDRNEGELNATKKHLRDLRDIARVLLEHTTSSRKEPIKLLKARNHESDSHSSV